MTEKHEFRGMVDKDVQNLQIWHILTLSALPPKAHSCQKGVTWHVLGSQEPHHFGASNLDSPKGSTELQEVVKSCLSVRSCHVTYVLPKESRLVYAQDIFHANLRTM